MLPSILSTVMKSYLFSSKSMPFVAAPGTYVIEVSRNYTSLEGENSRISMNYL